MINKLIKGTVFYASNDAQKKRLYKEGYTISTNNYHRLVEIEPNFIQLDLDSTGTNYVQVALEIDTK